MACLNDQLTSTDLRRMAQTIDIAFLDDLGDLIKSEGEMNQSEEPWLRSLVSSGLSEPIGVNMIDDVEDVYCLMTELARKLRSAYLSVQRAC